MIETALKTHIENGIHAALPNIDTRQIIVVVGPGKFDYTRNKSRQCLGSERLTVRAAIEHKGYIDRAVIIKAFPLCELVLSGNRVLQKYLGHEFMETVAVADNNTTTLNLEYTYDIFDED